MIPTPNDDLDNDFEIEEIPTLTYKMNINEKKLAGTADGLTAMQQAIYKVIYTERYKYPIYSWDYGIELDDLFGEAIDYVYPELKRRITEALLQDERITEVDNFSFTADRNRVLVKFTAHTIEGDVDAQRMVNV